MGCRQFTDHRSQGVANAKPDIVGHWLRLGPGHMACRAGWRSRVVLADDPFGVEVYLGEPVPEGDTVLALVIDFYLRMVGTHMAFATVVRLSGQGLAESMPAVAGVAASHAAVSIDSSHAGVRPGILVYLDSGCLGFEIFVLVRRPCLIHQADHLGAQFVLVHARLKAFSLEVLHGFGRHFFHVQVVGAVSEVLGQLEEAAVALFAARDGSGMSFHEGSQIIVEGPDKEPSRAVVAGLEFGGLFRVALRAIFRCHDTRDVFSPASSLLAPWQSIHEMPALECFESCH